MDSICEKSCRDYERRDPNFLQEAAENQKDTIWNARIQDSQVFRSTLVKKKVWAINHRAEHNTGADDQNEESINYGSN